jgi:hypothetical protein
VPFSKLFPGEIVTDQFLLQLYRNDQRVTECLSGFYERDVRTPEAKDFRRPLNGSTVLTLGVPADTIPIAI